MPNLKRNDKVYWIWGHPSNKELNFLNNIKSEVQKKLKSPKFKCHVTLAGPYQNIDESFLNKFKSLAINNLSISLEVNGYDYKKDQFESFFISIKNSTKLNNLRKKINELEGFKIQQTYSPHISLAYGIHETKEKTFLISNLPKLPIFSTISSISIVEVNESINHWKIIESFELK